MDGISSASAVIGLVQAATQVTTALARYVSRVKEAESSRAKLLDQIRLISNAETAIASIVQNSPRSAHTPELQDLIDIWLRDDGPPMKCKRELEELLRWLEKETENDKGRRWAKKIVWPMKEDKIQAAIRAFEGYIPYFRDVLSMKTFNLVDSMATRIKNTELARAKSELLLWLDGFDCTNKHDSTLRERQQTTGDWLLREELYIDWRKGSTEFIWLHGKAGAGKSVLASVVIDDLSNGLADNETLAYFYCDFRDIRCTSAMEVLRSVTKQLLWNSNKDWLSSFSDLTSRKARGAGPPTDLGTLFDLLKRAAELHERPVVVVDALDECEDLPKLLDELAKLAHGHCRLFVTSRTIHAIKVAFTGLPSITLDYRIGEMQDDMNIHIKTELESRSRLKILMQDLKDEIEGVLMENADGMFRWVQCQLDRLNECCSLGDVREVLDTLPATLYETYDQMLRAIDKKPFGSRRARRALTWLVTALAPLTISQLAEAMSISCDKPERDPVNALMHETVILDILGSFVTVIIDKIILSHYSVKEYLTSDTIADTYFIHRPTASLELATVSIFSLILFSDEFGTTVKDGKDPLYLYADDHGFGHLADCPSDHNESLVKHLLTLQNHICTHHPIYERHRFNSWMLVMPQPALYIMIYFGRLDLLRHYLDSHPVRATPADNPLIFAALYSSIPRVQLLLDNDFDVNLEGPVYVDESVRKMTPLIAAALNRTPETRESLVKHLLQNGCVVSRDAIHSILLPHLGAPCQPAVVRILLERGADPQWLDAERRSCLHLALTMSGASFDDEFEIARTLVVAGCDPTAVDDYGDSPFQLSIQSFSIELVRWLLGRGFQLPSDAISRAASVFYGRESLPMLEFLLAHGAFAGAQDVRGCNALHHLSRRQTLLSDPELIESVVRLLVKHGCNINCRNDAGETPLHLAAAYSGFELHILHPFLARGAELPVDIVNYAVLGFHNCFLIQEVQAERAIATLSFLVKKLGASCRLQTIGGDNPLHCLLKHNTLFPKVTLRPASFLLENGCDAYTPNSSGQTPLQLAIEHGHLPVARSILAQNTEPYAIDHTKSYHGDSEGNCILHRLCGIRWWYGQLEDKVKLLREAGYDFAKIINRQNNKGFTPLCITLMNGGGMADLAAITCLLNLGASFYHVNYLHLENLEWASNLPWYRDATDAQQRCLAQSKITFDHVILVHHHLRVACQGSLLSSTVASSILDMAEYWACMKVTRNNVRYTSQGGEQIAFPMVPGNGERWIPRRLVFFCKAGDSVPRTQDDHATIQVRIRRTGAVFTIPIYLNLKVDRNVPDLPSACFRVWDEFTPAVQVGGRQQLMVEELVPEDTLTVEFTNTNNDYFTLEFFHLEVYYTLKPLTRATSGDL